MARPPGLPSFVSAAGSATAAYPPTPAMKRFADSRSGRRASTSARLQDVDLDLPKFLNEHAPKKADGAATGKNEPKRVSPAQLLYAKKIAQGKGLVIPEEAKASASRVNYGPNSASPACASQDRLQAVWFSTRLSIRRGHSQNRRRCR